MSNKILIPRPRNYTLTKEVDKLLEPIEVVEFERKDDGYGCRECGFWFHETFLPNHSGQVIENHELHHYYTFETDIQKVLRGRSDLIKKENK